MINFKKIADSDDSVAHLYSVGLRGCENRQSLMKHIAKYHPVAADAYELAKLLDTDHKFHEYQTVTGLMRKNFPMTIELIQKYNAIWMPIVLTAVQMMATNLAVPWGTAFNKLLKDKHLIWKGDKIEISPKFSEETHDTALNIKGEKGKLIVHEDGTATFTAKDGTAVSGPIYRKQDDGAEKLN